MPLARVSDDQIFFGSVRFDKYLRDGTALTMEGGLADVAGPVLQTGIGRVQLLDVRRPWARLNFGSDRLNLLASYTGRKAPTQLALGPGTNLALDDDRFQVEGQGNWAFRQNKVTLVLGASAAIESIDTFDTNRGAQTLLFEPVDANQQAIFGQADWKVTKQLKLTLASRGDWNSLHAFQFRRRDLPFIPSVPNQSVRFTYNEAFQAPDYAELFLQTDAAPPSISVP